MTFKEKMSQLKEQAKSNMVKEDSTPEQLQAYADYENSLNELEQEYNKEVEEKASLKDTIVRLVSNQGDGKKPQEESGGSKPRTFEEIIAEKQQAKENK